MSKRAHNKKARGNGDDAGAMGDAGRALGEVERLMEEINVLRLEGALFCFDPREARRRSGSLSVELPNGEHGKHAVTIQIHPDFGQPSVLAYRVLQAIFLKLAQNGCQLTEEGLCLYPGKVSFTFRELARLCGRTGGTSRFVRQSTPGWTDHEHGQATASRRPEGSLRGRNPSGSMAALSHR